MTDKPRPTPRQAARFRNQLNARIDSLTQAAEDIRRLVSDAEDYLDTADRALEQLKGARDAISELV